MHRRVTGMLPDSARAWSNLGTALSAAGRREEAIAAILHAISFESHEPELHYNLGNALLEAGDPATAEAAFLRVLGRAPDHVGALTNLGCALKDQGRLAEAEAILRGAIALAPDNADLRWNLALALLAAGSYAEGWAFYEVRRAVHGFSIRPQKMPAWDGSPLCGRRLLVHAEQGLGDTLQFCRYLIGLRALGGEIVFEAPARLVPLLRSLPADIPVTERAEGPLRCDLHVPLLSLPHLLGPAAPFWPDSGPYISPEPARAARWAERLAGHAGLTVAIGWQGNAVYRNDAARSVPLAAFSPLASLPGLRLVSLQQGHGAEQIDAVPWRDGLLHLGEEIDRDGAFLDTAAILAHVDLVITSDTALAHLAGAMGVPIWLALAHVPDWRWGLAGAATPWYPAMRLFRQPARGDWRSVFDAMVRAIAELPA